MSEEIKEQVAITGLTKMEVSRLVANLRKMYSSIMYVDDSQEDVYALGHPLLDLITVLEKVASDLYGYKSAADLRALLAQRDGELEALRGKVAIEPAISMVVTVALAQLNRSENVTPNVAAACVLKLDEIRAALSDNQDAEQ